MADRGLNWLTKIFLTFFCWITVQDIHNKVKPEEVELVRRDYTANEGWETFLSYEDTRQVGTFQFSKILIIVTN